MLQLACLLPGGAHYDRVFSSWLAGVVVGMLISVIDSMLVGGNVSRLLLASGLQPS